MDTWAHNKKEHLKYLLNHLISSNSETDKKYFHVKTVENLIFHFDSISNESDKNWVYQSLVNYFDDCKDSAALVNKEKSKQLFYKHLDKITDYYTNALGFSLLLNRSIVYFFYLAIICISSYYFSMIVALAVISLILIQISYSINKTRLKKVYGLFY